MPTQTTYWTKPQLEARLSRQVVRELYDDNDDGTADSDTIAGLQRDSDSKVNSYFEPLGILPLDMTTLPPEVTRLSLDVAVALAAQRFPEVMKKDWAALMKQAEADLMNYRTGKTSLGVPAPGPQAVNQGVRVVEGDRARENAPTQSWWKDMGIF